MTPEDRAKLVRDVEAYCAALRPLEELCYVEHKRNDAIVSLAKEHSLLGMLVPREYGGRGADAPTYARALARINREGTGVRTFFSGHSSIGQYPILRYGTGEQRKNYLPPSCRGECTLAFGLTEPEAGSNPLEGVTSYRRDGDRWLLSGVKYLISNGSIASAVVVFAFPEGVTGKTRRMTAFIVETKGDTFRAEALHAKLGMFTADTAMFEMDGHPVPLGNMLGPEGEGFRIAMHTLVSGRLSVAAGCVGAIEDCLAEVLAYSRERRQHGKEIGKHQLVQEHIASIELARASSEAMVERAAQAKQASDESPGDRALLEEADLRVAEAKLFASNAAWEAADRAVQVFGGRGWSEPLPARAAPAGCQGLPHLRGNRRDHEAEDRGAASWKGVRGVPLSVVGTECGILARGIKKLQLCVTSLCPAPPYRTDPAPPEGSTHAASQRAHTRSQPDLRRFRSWGSLW